MSFFEAEAEPIVQLATKRSMKSFTPSQGYGSNGHIQVAEEAVRGHVFWVRSNYILTVTGRGHKAYEPGTGVGHTEAHKPPL